jgi:A/G-specific adenine glycosylase
MNKLLKNHTKYKRDFAWRHNITPYRIMIAEFMLQRTKAEQVEPVYKQFLKEFPNIKTLANAPFKKIVKYTANLGLHKRAKHFINAAKFINKEFNGKIPNTPDELLMIPGVGEYVAGAILTVCFNKKYPVVDSNIARFINRYYGMGLTGEIRRKKEIKRIAGRLFNIRNPGKLLFALIDFTALICKPINPGHDNCILRKNCKYYRGRTTTI